MAAAEEMSPRRKSRRVIAGGRHVSTGKALSLPMLETYHERAPRRRGPYRARRKTTECEHLTKVRSRNKPILDITNDIQSLASFRRRSRDFLKQLKESKRPVVRTVKG